MLFLVHSKDPLLVSNFTRLRVCSRALGQWLSSENMYVRAQAWGLVGMMEDEELLWWELTVVFKYYEPKETYSRI